jgi:hypothetical protein
MSRMVRGVSITAIGFAIGFAATGFSVGVAAGAAVAGRPVSLVSMFSFRVFFLRCRLQKPKPVDDSPGTRGPLGQRVVLNGVRFLPHFTNRESTIGRFH